MKQPAAGVLRPRSDPYVNTPLTGVRVSGTDAVTEVPVSHAEVGTSRIQRAICAQDDRDEEHRRGWSGGGTRRSAPSRLVCRVGVPLDRARGPWIRPGGGASRYGPVRRGEPDRPVVVNYCDGTGAPSQMFSYWLGLNAPPCVEKYHSTARYMTVPPQLPRSKATTVTGDCVPPATVWPSAT